MAQLRTNVRTEDASPNPEYLIKSIAEQGYSLETSLADLIDNSISANANKVEILCDMDTNPFKLFLADNGGGMTNEELIKNMQFPSRSPEDSNEESDLGRFGLGMKTASFSQTRKFTVLSKKEGETKYHGRTWDVGFLKVNGWKIIVNTDAEVARMMYEYNELSNSFTRKFDDYRPNTIVIWEGLYKFEEYLEAENKRNALQSELTEVTTEYLALVFHRFMEKEENPLQIRINNTLVEPFNPFPEEESDFRQVQPRQRNFREDVIKMEGFILPSRSIMECKNGLTNWVTKNRSLTDMEGLYIYRANRIILFGGWNGIIKKNPRLQLARLRVEVGNRVDNLIHLNVAKSQIVVPYELRNAFEDYIFQLKDEAVREFYNVGVRDGTGVRSQNHINLFERSSSSKGTLLEVNKQFPLVKSLHESLDKKQKSQLNLLLRMLNSRMNKIRQVHEEKDFVGIEENDGIKIDDLKTNIIDLIGNGVPKEMIKEEIIPHLGFKFSSLPDEIKSLLK